MRSVDPSTAFHLALLSATIWDDPEAMIGFASPEADPGGNGNILLSKIASLALERTFQDLRSGTPALGFVFAGSYRHQPLPLAIRLREHGYKVLAILDHREWNPGNASALDDYLALPTISIPDPSWLSRLGDLDAVFSPDTAYRFLEHLPKNVKRIAFQHGLTAVPEYSIAYEGGGTTFDHLLLTEKPPSFDPDILAGIYPRSMVRHGADALKLIPAGWPKLDDMINAFAACHGSPSRKVIVHLSVQDHDSPEGMRLLPDAMEQILAWDPPVEIVFRPFPGVSYPFAEAVLERFRGSARFQVSTSESYVQDYKDASALVTLKPTTAEIFSLATGIPNFCLFPEHPAGPFARGTFCKDVDDLLLRLRRQLENPWEERTRILAERDLTYVHVGRSLDAMVESLPSILDGSSQEEWLRLSLPAPPGTDDQQEHAAALEKLGSDPRYATKEFEVQVIRSAFDHYPDSPTILVKASRLLLRIARRHQAVRPGQQMARHLLCFAELALLVVCAAKALQRALPQECAGLDAEIDGSTQDALQMALVLEWAEKLVPGYGFPPLEAVRRFLTDPNAPIDPVLDTLATYRKAHPNLPVDPPNISCAIRNKIVERALKLLAAGAVDHSERIFATIPATALLPEVLQARLRGILDPDRIRHAPSRLLEILRTRPDLSTCWNALAVTLAETPWAASDVQGLEGILPHVFDEEERLSTLWNAATAGGNRIVLQSLVRYLEGIPETPRDLVRTLSNRLDTTTAPRA